MAEFRKLDLSPMESKDKRKYRWHIRNPSSPEFVLYSMIILGGKFNTRLMVSLPEKHQSDKLTIREEKGQHTLT